MPVIEHVAAMTGMYQNIRLGKGLFGINHRRQRFVVHLYQFQGVFGDIGVFGDHDGDPFSGIAGHLDGQGIPFHLG